MGAKKFGMSFETQGMAGYPGISARYPGNLAEKFEKKVCVQFLDLKIAADILDGSSGIFHNILVLSKEFCLWGFSWLLSVVRDLC